MIIRFNESDLNSRMLIHVNFVHFEPIFLQYSEF